MKKTKYKQGTHLFTSRGKGTERFVVEAVMLIALLFIGCSFYALILVPENSAAWSMATFFIIAFLLLVLHEKDNVFPDIPNKKLPWAAATWFLAFHFVAFLSSFIVTMNIGHLVFAVFFGLPLLLTSLMTFRRPKKKTSKKKHRISPGY